MPIDDVRLGACQSELFEDHVTDFLLSAVDVVEALLLVMRLLLCDEVALEGGHRRLVEEGRVWTTPEIPHVVDGLLVLGLICGRPVGETDELIDSVHHSLTRVHLLADTYLTEGLVLVERHGGVEEKIVIVGKVHTALLV